MTEENEAPTGKDRKSKETPPPPRQETPQDAMSAEADMAPTPRPAYAAGQRGVRFTIARKLGLLFVAVSVLPIAIIGFMSYSISKAALQKQVLEELTAISHGRELAIAIYLEDYQESAAAFASDGHIRDTLEAIAQKGRDSKDLGRTLSLYLRNEKMVLYQEIYEIFVLNSRGTVIASSDENQIGIDKSHDEYFTGGKKKPHIKDAYFSRSTGKESLAFSAPLTNRRTGKLMGVLVTRVETKTLNRITGEREGLGETGEVYIVNKNGYMITHSRFQKDTFLKQRVDSEPVRSFLNQDKEMAGIYTDYRGRQVLGASNGEHLKGRLGLGWLVMAELDVAEALAPIAALRKWMVLVSLATIAIVAGIALLIAGSIVNPLQNAVSKIKEIARSAGDLTQEIEVRSNDEVGDLAVAFNEMIATLGEFVNRVRSAGVNLVSSSAQILSASQQNAAAAQQQSTQITEVATAVGEVTATAKQISQTANEVAKLSDGAIKTAQDGSKAILDTAAAVNTIRTSVKETAGRIEELGKKSKKITGILDLLDDITEQTNLLALNAAIEASRAGEAGRGFSVVADEIRKLADGSRKASKDIGALIEEIQSETLDTVAGMEENTKLVEEGSLLAGKSGEAIKEIIESIGGSSRSIKQITLSTQQQTTGTAQVAQTMAGIDTAVKQTMASTEQSMRSARDLAAMAEQLKRSVAQFKIRGRGNHHG